MPNVADVISSILKEQDIKYVFGIPGDESLDLLESFRTNNIEFILTKHETSAAIMASVYGEITGNPGICFVTKAPGVLNLMNGLGHAYLDRMPVLALTGQYPQHVYETVVRQKLNHQEILRGTTKWSGTITAATAQQILLKAIRIATAPREGPVHLDLPGNISTQASEYKEIDKVKRHQVIGSIGISVSDALNMAKKMLQGAKAPVIIAGLGVRRSRAHKELQDFAQQLQIPVFTTVLAKSTVPGKHPFYAGTFLGGNLELNLIEKSDLIIAVGLDIADIYTTPWKLSQPILYIDSVPNTDEFYHADLELIGDIGFILNTIKDMPLGEGRWDPSEVRRYKLWLNETLTAPADGLTVKDMVDVTRKLLPDDGIVTCDAGFSKTLVLLLWEGYAEDTFFTSHGLSTMGYSLPAALAAKILYPQRYVVSMMGDGSFAMRATEIEVAVRMGLPITIVVFSDECLSQIGVKQQRKGYPPYGVHFKNPDYVKFAESYGALGFDVKTVDEYQAALVQALNSQKPAIIGAHITSKNNRQLFDAIRG
ncbi:MAG: acetolactate synthase large subunit [Clostridia bacterium]|nr:acetolactate synthase large subunit [Clostridia bacterium]